MVTYLSFSAFNTGLCDSYDEFEERKATHKLYRYAAENWGHHAREAWELVDFLESDRKREAASQIAMARPDNYYGDKLRDVTATHLAGYFGTCEVMALLLEKGHSPSATDTYMKTPLWWAATNGHAAVVELLLERDVDLASEDTDDRLTPLRSAAKNGHSAIVKLLL